MCVSGYVALVATILVKYTMFEIFEYSFDINELNLHRSFYKDDAQILRFGLRTFS